MTGCHDFWSQYYIRRRDPNRNQLRKHQSISSLFIKYFPLLTIISWKTGFPSCLPEKPAAPLGRFFLHLLLDERKRNKIYSEPSMS